MSFKNWCSLLVLAFFVAAAAVANGGGEITDPADFMRTRFNLTELPAPGYNLEERLAKNGGFVECWRALLQINSCYKDIVYFFLHRQAKIGPDCCRAINVITQKCWPIGLSYLGFTPEEGNILKGHCDGSAPTPAN